MMVDKLPQDHLDGLREAFIREINDLIDEIPPWCEGFDLKGLQQSDDGQQFLKIGRLLGIKLYRSGRNLTGIKVLGKVREREVTSGQTNSDEHH